ncbi:YggT family protein [Candidatus Poribacteria bacterium]|nr:YggT family protein [Candidatus Poribacteria bacterium]
MYQLARFISFLIEVYAFVIVIRAIISWVNPNPYNPIVQLLYKVTEPVLEPIRRILFRSTGNMRIDFSPFIAIMLLYIIRSILLRLF